MEAVNGVSEGDKGGPPPPSPLTGCYLLIVIGEPHCNEHKDIILQRVAKGLLSWDVNDCLVDLEKELAIITEQALEGEEARYGERLIQFASENLVTEILIHPVVSTLAQCVRNLLSSFTRHRHIIHAGYTFANNGSWVLQDGTFSSTDFSEAFQEIEVLRVIRAYENGISLHLHCAPEGDWTRLPKEPFTKGCKAKVNPNDVLTAGSPSISSFINYLEPFLVSAELENILESSDVVGNIRFSRPTLYVFPGGQGDAALFGINGFNMLLDGGFSRKACFWDFVRHLDRLDAVLLTRLNNSNVNGISAVLRRKKQNALYPQIGHFFCNIQERKAILSPDGDKDKDPLLINLLEEGQEIVSNLRHLSLIPQVCYRDSEPINLYHKVGHGTLDMYVLSPAKDSKEVREFLQKWNNNDQKMFANQRSSKEFVIPLQNLVSICALLVWQPANPEDTITRILFPGSSPQNKIFEGLEKIKSLDFIKHPVCSEKSLAPATIIKAKQSVIERIIQPEKKIPLDNKREKIQKPPAEVIDTEMKNGDVNGIQPVEKSAPVKKSDSTESEKSISKPKKIIENGDKIEKAKPKPKMEPRTKPRSESQQRKVKTAEKKPSPTTPKKQGDDLPKTKPKPSPSSTPAKSTKEANNRKVVESKIKAAPPKKEAPKPATEKKEVKVERKPISRRPKDISKLAGSPSKKVNGVQKPDTISRRGKLDKEGTTDSSTVSTPSAEQDSILKKEIKDISKLTTEEIQNLKAQELADLKEEQEAVKEIEAVFRKGELQEDKPSDFRKIKDISIEDKLESEEYIIIEKTEIEQDMANELNKEEETQKIARDSEESEKQRKLSEEKETAIEENRMEIQDEVQKIITSATDIVKAKEEVVEASKEVSIISPEEKIDISTDKKDIEEIKEIAQESQPDEKGSANIESGATTTAPTLPEDERMPLDEIKEDNGDQVIEEKHVKEDTKEKDVPVIQLPPKTFESTAKLPPVVGIRLDKQSHIRDIVKTPDEVADLPVHEEVEFDHYDEYPSATETKSEEVEGEKKQADVAVEKEKTDVDVKDEEVKIEDKKDEKTEAIQKDVKTVISEDLNKKELSKSPDEEKDTDEHELKQKKEEAELPTQVEAIKEEKVDANKDVEQKEVKIEELDKRKESLVQEEVVEKSEIEVKEKDEGKERLDELKKMLPDVPSEEVIVEKQLETEIPTPKKEEAKLKEDVITIQKIEDKLQKLKEESPEEIKTEPHLIKQAVTPPEKDEVELKENVTSLEKVDEKLQKLKEDTQKEQIQAVSEVITHKVEAPQHAEPVVITTDSLPDSPGGDEAKIEDKLHLGRKSPKEREEDVAKIVASVAEVLKSDAPLEEFEGKLPFSIPYKTYTTELRETHITTVESPVTDESKPLKEEEETICPKASSISLIEEERKIAPIHEEPVSKISKMIQDSNELMQATSKMIKDIKQTQPKEEEQDADGGTVHRMLVTASSEDGGEEIEICPPGTITFSRSSESSGRSSPDPMSQKQSQKSSIADTFSDATVITKSMAKDDKDVKEEDKTICDKKDKEEVVEKVEIKQEPVTEAAPSKEILEKTEVDESSKAIEGIQEPVKDIKEETKPTEGDEKVIKAEKIEPTEEKKSDIDAKPSEEKKEDKVEEKTEEHKEVLEETKAESDVKVKEDIAVEEKIETVEAAVDIESKTLDEKKEEKEQPSAAEKAEKIEAALDVDTKTLDKEAEEKEKPSVVEKAEKIEAAVDIDIKTLDEKKEEKEKPSVVQKEEKVEAAKEKEVEIDVKLSDEKGDELPADKETEKAKKNAEIDSTPPKQKDEKDAVTTEKIIDKKLSEEKDREDADKEKEKMESIDSEVKDEKKDIFKEDKLEEIKEKKTETVTEEKEKTDEIAKSGKTEITEEKTEIEVKSLNETDTGKELEKTEKLEGVDVKKDEIEVKPSDENQNAKKDLIEAVEKAGKVQPSEEKIDADKKLETTEEKKTEIDVKPLEEKEQVSKDTEKIEISEIKKIDAKSLEEKKEDVKEPAKLETTEEKKSEFSEEKVVDAKPLEEKKEEIGDSKKLETVEEKKTEIDVKEQKEEVSEKVKKIETSEEKKVDAKPPEQKKEEIKEPEELKTIDEKKTEIDVKSSDVKQEESKETDKLDVSEKQKDEANEKPLDKNIPLVEETKEEKKSEINVKPLEEKKDVTKEDIFEEEKSKITTAFEDKEDPLKEEEKLDKTEEQKIEVEVKSSEEKKDINEEEKVETTKETVKDTKPSEETKEQKYSEEAQKLEEHKMETDEQKGEVKEAVETLTKSTVSALESVKDEVKKVEHEAAAKVDAVEKEIKEKRSFLGGLVNDIGASLINDTSKLIEDAQHHIEDMKESAKSKITDLKEDLSSKKEIFENEIEDDIQAIEEAAGEVSKKKENLIESVTEEVKSTKEGVEEQIKDVEEAVATQKATVTGVIADVKSAVTKDLETKVQEIKEQVIDTKEKTKSELEEISKLATEEVKKTVDEKTEATKKVVEDIKEKAATEMKELATKTEAVLEDIKTKEESITKTLTEETKQAADSFEEKKEQVVQKMENLSKDLAKVEVHAKDVVESTSDAISSVKKDVLDTNKEEEAHKYDLYNGLESVEKMVVDVLTADREDESKSDKTTVSSIIEKAEHDVEKIVDKGVSEVKEFVEETKEAISSFFKREPSKEEILEKTAHDIEQNYEAVSDMAKSVVFEKCEEKIEKRLERSAESLQKDYEDVADMAKSIVFEKCEKPLTEVQKEEKVLETSAKNLEEEYKAVSDMAQSVVFDKCENLTKVEKEEKALEKSAKSIEEEYKEVTDMAQSMVFEKCEKPLTEEQKEENFLEKAAKNVEEEYKVVSDMAQSMVFDKCDLKQEEIGATKVDDKTDGPAKLSGKSSPEKLEDDDLAAKLSGKSSPAFSSDLKDIAKEGSGKSTPDIREVDHIKVDNQDSLLSGKSSPGLSGKSSPILSGRSSPGLKAESKDSLLSGKSSPEHTKPDSKESSLSGKSSPALSGDIKVSEQEKVDLSAKSSPAVSGKTSPMPSVGKSGKTTPDARVEQIHDRKSPELSTKAPIKDSDVCDLGKVEPVEKKSDSEVLDKLPEQTTDSKSIKEDLTKEDVVKEGVIEKVEEVSAKAADIASDIKSAIQEKKTETTEEKPVSKTTLEVQEIKEKKLSVSDVQISIKGEEEKVAEKSASDLSKSESPEDTKQVDEKTETRELDSIDSGIGTDLDSKTKKLEEQPLKDKDTVVKILEMKEESIAGPSLSPPRASTEDLHLSGKSTPDIAEVEKLKEIEESLKSEKHILGSTTPPTVPVSPVVKEISSTQTAEAKISSPTPVKSSIISSIKESDIRSCTPGSDDYEIGASTHSDISSGQVSRAPHLLESERIESDEDDDVPGSPLSITSQVPHSRSSSRYDFEDERIGTKMDPMNTSFYGALPDEEDTELDFDKAISEHRQTRGEDLVVESPSHLYEVTKAKFSVKPPEPESQLDQINKNGASNVMTASFMGDLPSSTTSTETKKDVVESWGKPLGLPSPAPPNDNKGTPKKERKLPANVSAKNKLNDDKKRAESPSKYKNKKLQPVYVDLTYVPHHGNAYYSYVDFFKRVRARYYVFSGIEPSREVYNALLEAKQTWEDKELEVTIIPTYDTDILGYWVAENEELLTKYKIDLSPSASRCTINLQDHETSCSAYRLEF